MNPADFCFEHFGRHFAPESRDAWASKPYFHRFPKAGKPSRATRLAGAGIGVVITPSCVHLLGVVPPPGVALPFKAEFVEPAKGSLPVFVNRFLFTPPAEPWVGVTFSNAGLNPAELFINISSRDVRFVADSGGSRIHLDLDLIRRVAEAWGDAPMKFFYPAYHMTVSRRANEKQTPAAQVAWEKYPEGVRRAMSMLLDNSAEPYILKRFLDWRASQNV